MLRNILFLLCELEFFKIRILFFRPRLNSCSYFSAEFRLKIFSYYSYITFPFENVLGYQLQVQGKVTFIQTLAV